MIRTTLITIYNSESKKNKNSWIELCKYFDKDQEDNESKFGTLILLNKSYEIQNDKAAIQIGRTVFTFVMKYLKNNQQMVVEQANK